MQTHKANGSTPKKPTLRVQKKLSLVFNSDSDGSPNSNPPGSCSGSWRADSSPIRRRLATFPSFQDYVGGNNLGKRASLQSSGEWAEQILRQTLSSAADPSSPSRPAAHESPRSGFGSARSSSAGSLAMSPQLSSSTKDWAASTKGEWEPIRKMSTTNGGRPPRMKTLAANSMAMLHGTDMAFSRHKSCPTLTEDSRPATAHGFITPKAGRRTYEEACRARNLLPKFLRPAQHALVGEDFTLINQGLGDQQLEALLCDDDLVPRDRIRRWRLRDARLTGVGLASLVTTLTERTQGLDLMYNELDAGPGISTLADAMKRGALRNLKYLNLTADGLRNAAAGLLASGLLHCPKLLRLELNHNAISDGAPLGNLVGEHKTLARLAISCNFLSGGGVAALFRGIERNSRAGGHLADVDVSWNGIGDDRALEGARAIADALRSSGVLYHLDLSYNSLDAECCAAIGDGLKDNHCLYGLHLVGNAAAIDADGFLTPLRGVEMSKQLPPTPKRELSGTLGSTLGDPSKVLGSSPEVAAYDAGAFARLGSRAAAQAHCGARAWSDGDILRERDVLERATTCWACEGWERQELEWTPEADEELPAAVWAYTSLDNFRSALRLKKVHGARRFAVARMIPRDTKVLVIFQVDASLKVPPGLEVEFFEGRNPVDIKLRACAELPDLQPGEDQEIVERREERLRSGEIEHHIVARYDRAGILCSGPRPRPSTPAAGPCSPCLSSGDGPSGRRVLLLDGPGGVGAVQMPRVTETEFKMVSKKPRAKSFFKDFRRESPELLKRCMQLDMSRAKLKRLVPDSEAEALQAVLQKHYRRFNALYRHLSAFGLDGTTNTFGVSQGTSSDILTAAGILDDVTRLSDADRLFIASRVLPHELKDELAVRNDKCLVRFQILELIVRVAQQRFVQTGQMQSITEAVTRVLESLSEGGGGQSLLRETDDFFAAFHTEDVDDVYKANQQLLRQVFDRFSGLRTPPGQAKFMSLGEFQSLLDLLGAYDSRFQSRQSACVFRMAMMTQVEETYSSRFQEMTFLEFQHAIGAVVFYREGFEASKMARLLADFFSKSLPSALPSKQATCKKSLRNEVRGS
eukprot:TRINITY_DN35703_c0_g1_i1.p1 TRINITY_DN35703_c0_g1~~TRINITY_DN35703_c0_g1_i1.p1  ORF type:complete len:1091 (+),score=258.84 TRINITY_DN35703_c0_g1_i1:94-3366(+)